MEKIISHQFDAYTVNSGKIDGMIAVIKHNCGAYRIS